MNSPKSNEKGICNRISTVSRHAVANKPELSGDKQHVYHECPGSQRQRAVEAQHVVHARYRGCPQRRTQDQHDSGGQEIKPGHEQQVSAHKIFHRYEKQRREFTKDFRISHRRGVGDPAGDLRGSVRRVVRIRILGNPNV